MRIEFVVLPRPTPTIYLGMTASGYAPLLESAETPEYVLPIAAIGEGQPLGFGLAKCSPGSALGDVLSLFVEPNYQRRGIGAKLLELLETGLAAVGCREARIGYFSPAPSLSAVERILEKRGWGPPKVRMLSVEIGSAIAREASWVQNVRTPAGFEIFSWNELLLRDHRALEAIRETAPDTLWPFREDVRPDPTCSVGLRRNGEVIGWMIVHWAGGHRLVFASLFVRAPWRRSALNLALLTEAIRRAYAHYGEAATALVEVQIENAPMRRLLERKLLPFAVRKVELRQAMKRLADAPSP